MTEEEGEEEEGGKGRGYIVSSFPNAFPTDIIDVNGYMASAERKAEDEEEDEEDDEGGREADEESVVAEGICIVLSGSTLSSKGMADEPIRRPEATAKDEDNEEEEEEEEEEDEEDEEEEEEEEEDDHGSRHECVENLLNHGDIGGGARNNDDGVDTPIGSNEDEETVLIDEDYGESESQNEEEGERDARLSRLIKGDGGDGGGGDVISDHSDEESDDQSDDMSTDEAARRRGGRRRVITYISILECIVRSAHLAYGTVLKGN